MEEEGKAVVNFFDTFWTGLATALEGLSIYVAGLISEAGQFDKHSWYFVRDRKYLYGFSVTASRYT